MVQTLMVRHENVQRCIHQMGQRVERVNHHCDMLMPVPMAELSLGKSKILRRRENCFAPVREKLVVDKELIHAVVNMEEESKLS